MKTIILGTGFLGKKLYNFFKSKGTAIATDLHPRKDVLKLDLTNKKEVEDFLKKENPEVVIDTVGLASSIQCEENPELAEKTNYITAKNVAEICKEINARMVFVSSSFLFDGKKGNYHEEDVPNSSKIYSKTKVKAEKETLAVPNSIVIRTELMYGEDGKEIKYGSAILSDKVQISNTTQIRQPVFVDDVPRIIYELLTTNQSGIFNIAGPEKMTFFEFLQNLKKINKDFQISIKDKEYIDKNLPLDVSLDLCKITSLGIKTTPLNNAVDIINQNLSEQS